MGNVDKLIKKLTDNKAETRKLAAMELGKIGDLRAVDPLIRRLKDDDESVRVWACASLGKLGDETALEPLVRVVMTDTTKVKREAAGAVVKIVPSFDDVNIDEVIKKIENIYQEFAIEQQHEEEMEAGMREFELEKERQVEKQAQEKYFEELHKTQEEHLEQKPVESTKIKTKKAGKAKRQRPPPVIPVPTTEMIKKDLETKVNLEPVEVVEEEPEITLTEFMSALKKGTIDERMDELSNIVMRVMDLFVTAIDDISVRLTNLENRMGSRPSELPTYTELSSGKAEIKPPGSIKVLPTRAALNEELKKVLLQRKID